MTLEPQVAVPTRRSAATDAECSAKASRGAAAGREVLDERRDIAEELRVAGGAKNSRCGSQGHLDDGGELSVFVRRGGALRCGLPGLVRIAVSSDPPFSLTGVSGLSFVLFGHEEREGSLPLRVSPRKKLSTLNLAFCQKEARNGQLTGQIGLPRQVKTFFDDQVVF